MATEDLISTVSVDILSAGSASILRRVQKGLAAERRGRKIQGQPAKLPKEIEEDLIAENQRLRAENAYLKNLQALVLEEERCRRRNRW